MVAYPQLFDSADVTLQTAPIAVSQTSGTTYGPTTYHLWNDKGGSLSASTLKNCRIRPVVFNGISRVSSGFPLLDEAWVQIHVSGLNNVGDSTMSNQTTGFVPVGASNPLILSDIPKNCARFIDVQIVVPAGAGNLSQEVYLELVYDEASVVMPFRVGALLGPGVLPDWIDPSARRVRRGFTITASGAATVTVSDGSFVFDGILGTVIRQTLTLNQNDGAASALIAGQSYIAVISIPSTGIAHATKGTRGTPGLAPSLPANEVLLGYVTVSYQAGGTSIINQNSVDQSLLLYGEYVVTAGTGLNVNIGAGLAITTSDSQTFSGSRATLSVADNGLSTVWLKPDGTLVTAAAFISPAIGAIPLAQVNALAGAITLISDVRPFSGRTASEIQVVLSWMGPINQTGLNFATNVGLLVDSYGLATAQFILDSVDLEIGTLGTTSTSGKFLVEIVKWNAGVQTSAAPTFPTLYPSSGTQDLRPSIAYNASLARSSGNRGHEVTTFEPGSRFAAYMAAVPAGFTTDSASDYWVVLHFRKQ